MDAHGFPKQDIMTFELLIGSDGKKMSKTSPNTIAIDEAPQSMYQKLEGHDILLRESMGIHECASCEEIEVLIIPTEFDVTRTIALRDRDRIISLHDRIEEFLE